MKFKWFLIAVVIAFIGFQVYTWQHKKWLQQQEQEQTMLVLQKLQSVTKLVIWEQDFVLTDVTTLQKNYLGLFTSEEKLSTQVPGKMGFHIDLSDTIHTKIKHTKDSVFIKAPLKITYVTMQLSAMQQTKESSLDPTLNIDKEAVIKKLDAVALQKYLPGIIQQVQNQSLADQQRYLGNLIGKPVAISFSKMPTANEWVERPKQAL
jgi:hypothetical protein